MYLKFSENTGNKLESINGTKISDGLNEADILEILQKNTPSGYKYCLTLVPRKTETLEKVLKNWNVSAKKVNPAAGIDAPKPRRHKISMHGAVITTEECTLIKKLTDINRCLTDPANRCLTDINRYYIWYSTYPVLVILNQ